MHAVLPILIFAFLHMALTPRAEGQADRIPRIEIVDIEPAITNQDGVSVNPSTVIYRIEFIPPNATHAEIQLLRDQEVIRTWPAPMKAGLNQVILPAGLPMDDPANYIAAQVALPGGSLSEPSVVGVHEAADFQLRDRLAKARFDRIVPDLLTAKRTTQFVRIFGADLDAHVDTLTLGGMSVRARMVGPVLRVEIPPDAFQLPGFVTLQPQQDFMGTPVNPNQQVSIAIADPTLPAPGGLTSPRVDAVEYVGNQYSERLRVRGFGFRRNQKIVIGRGRTPIQAQDAEMQDQKVMTTWVPAAPPADDYFIAVLSADGMSMTRPFLIPSPDRMRATSPVRPDRTPEEPRLTAPGFRIFGDVAWNATEPQWVNLEGPIAKPGLMVSLRRDGPSILVEAVEASPTMASRKHPVVRVPVPRELTYKARYDVKIVIHTK